MSGNGSLCTQAAADLEKLKTWLATYPHWEGTLQVDYTHGRAPNAGLLPKGLEETSRQEDVVGNLQLGCRYQFDLFWKISGQGDDAQNASRLLDFQQWVQQQSILGLTPRFGDVPAREQIRAEKGGLTAGTQITTYTATLIADFMKLYEVK